MALRIRSWHLTDVGCVRDHNEDNGYADPEGRFFICSDGMGGHAAGDVASAMAVQSITSAFHPWPAVFDHFAEDPEPNMQRAALGMIDGALRNANSAVHNRGKAERDKHGMGCTCDIIVIAGHRALCGHVGDSRQYFIRDGQVMQLTQDHSFAPPPLPGQAQAKGKLTSALGPNPQCRVDTFVVELLRGDQLVMCTDGLADYFPDPREIAMILTERGDESGVRFLIDSAKARGGADNITVVLIKVEQQEVQPQSSGSWSAMDRARAQTYVPEMDAPSRTTLPGIPQAQRQPRQTLPLEGLAQQLAREPPPSAPMQAQPAQPQQVQQPPASVPPRSAVRNAGQGAVVSGSIGGGGGGGSPSPPDDFITTARGKLQAPQQQQLQEAAARMREGTVGGPAQPSAVRPAVAAPAPAPAPAVAPGESGRTKTVVDKMGVFTTSALFSGVPTTEVFRLVGASSIETLPPGQPVPRTWKGNDTAWFIVDGEHKGELLYPEALIASQEGWGDLDSPQEATPAVPISRKDFVIFCNSTPPVGVKLLVNVSKLITAELRTRAPRE